MRICSGGAGCRREEWEVVEGREEEEEEEAGVEEEVAEVGEEVEAEGEEDKEAVEMVDCVG